MRGPEQAQATTPDNDPSASPSSDVIVQIKAKLLGVSKPPVWRRLQLRADTRLDHLHEMIVAAFGWQDHHMHVFTIGPEEFGVPEPELGFADERHVSIGELIGGIGDKLRYTYDFGDDWEHEITVEDLLDADPDPTTQSSLPRKAPAHPRTAAAAGDTPTSKKSLPTPATNETKR